MTTTTVTASGEVSAERVWTLLATPACWPAWAPHMRHVSSADEEGAPATVAVGQQLQIHTIAPLVRVPVRVTAVQAGVSWTMEADLPLGQIRSGHRIDVHDDVAEVSVTLSWDGPALLGQLLLRSYRPVAHLSVHRLLDLAGAEQDGATTALQRLCL